MKTLRAPHDLSDIGLVAADRVAALEQVAARYAVALTPALSELIDPADPTDPIARQFVPDEAELNEAVNESTDPIGDDAHSPVPGLVHRYPDRVLLKIAHVCAAYCRFCFRREAVGPASPHSLSREQFEAALQYVRMHPAIWEVILTGGDPLVLSPRRVHAAMNSIGAIDHVRVVRIHTRMPVADPARIDGDLVGALKMRSKPTYVVLHANHPRELTAAARAACARIVDAGIPMLSQTVLLRGVNDDSATLGALMRALVECRVKPYYLHHGDLAKGTGHLRTDIADGQRLVGGLRGYLSGLCQPTYVLDIPGGYGKAPVGPNAVSVRAGRYVVRDYQGRVHHYPPGEGEPPRHQSGGPASQPAGPEAE